eukprot:GHVL01018468.1.p1 GENE.GHVL01018468.1~~GHVL01018468.1.p1  ORF type:complete len:509 (-),score=100.67 GHVL01018468.1:81-1607(-)
MLFLTKKIKYSIYYNRIHNRIRLYTDSTDRRSAIRSFSNKDEILKYYSENLDMDIETTSDTFMCLSRPGIRPISKNDLLEFMKDSRFINILQNLQNSAHYANCRILSNIAQSCAMFFSMTPEIIELSQKISEISLTRENGFNPTTLAKLAIGLSVCSNDPRVIEFIKLETEKILPDFTPRELIIMLQTVRKWKKFDKKFLDLLIEKLTDEIDRFTIRDVSTALEAIADLSLARGFLTKRIATLAFENLNSFDQRQLVVVLTSLVKIRFISIDNFDSIFDCLKIKDLSPNLLSQVCFACASIEHNDKINEVRQMIQLFMQHESNLHSMMDVAWSICYFQLHDATDTLKQLVENIVARPPKNPATILKFAEVIQSLRLEFPSIKVDIPMVWYSACSETSRIEQEQIETSRLHVEVLLFLDNLKGRFKVKTSKNQIAGTYRVDMLDSQSKLAFDLDRVSKPVIPVMKHRHLRLLGFKPVLIQYWQWRRCKTEEQQVGYLQKLISEALGEPL